MTSFQLLSVRVELEVDDPNLAERLNYLPTSARQDVEVRKVMRYQVEGEGPWLVREDGDLVDVLHQVDDVLWTIYLRLHSRVLERYSLAGWSVFHGALVNIRGARLLLLGEKGVGKTTLATALLYSGYTIEGDEMVLERDSQVLAVPRRLHLKTGIESLVPEIAPLLADQPIASTVGQRVVGFDPGEAGFEWVISPHPIDGVIVLEANHDGATESQRLPIFETLRSLVESSLGWVQSPSTLVAAATRLSRYGGHRLKLGEPKDGVAHLEEVAHESYSPILKAWEQDTFLR